MYIYYIFFHQFHQLQNIWIASVFAHYEHSCTQFFRDIYSHFSSLYTQEWNCWVIWQLCQTVFPNSGNILYCHQWCDKKLRFLHTLASTRYFLFLFWAVIMDVQWCLSGVDLHSLVADVTFTWLCALPPSSTCSEMFPGAWYRPWWKLFTPEVSKERVVNSPQCATALRGVCCPSREGSP